VMGIMGSGSARVWGGGGRGSVDMRRTLYPFVPGTTGSTSTSTEYRYSLARE
jgi:hypothetical protein